jgi:hypothetical protein
VILDLGPLYFCLELKELLESVRSVELVIGYLDDVAMGGDRGDMCLLKDFLHLETVREKAGLELNGVGV